MVEPSHCLLSGGPAKDGVVLDGALGYRGDAAGVLGLWRDADSNSLEMDISRVLSRAYACFTQMQSPPYFEGVVIVNTSGLMRHPVFHSDHEYGEHSKGPRNSGHGWCTVVEMR